MKKLFTFLILACAFLVGNAQSADQGLYVGCYINSSSSNPTISEDKSSITFTFDGVELLKISAPRTDNTGAGSFSIAGSSNTIEYNGSAYRAINIVGASSTAGGSDFTPTFPANVKVTMYAIQNSTTSVKTENITMDGKDYPLYPRSGGTSTHENAGTVTQIPLTSGVPFHLAGVTTNTIYVIEKAVINGFEATPANITQTSAEINVTYTPTNVNDETTFTLYYKDSNDNEYSSVQAESTGGTISLSGLTAETEYAYDVYLAVNGEKADNTSTTVNFTTLSSPTIPWTVNYAEIASSILTYSTNIAPGTEGDSYASTDRENNITIGKQNNNYQFEVVYNNKKIISKDNVTSGGNVSLRFGYGNNNNSTGLFTSGSGTIRYGVLNLKEGDIVEIAILTGGEYDNTSAPTSLINLTNQTQGDDYILQFDRNGTQTVKYKVYRHTVSFDDPSYTSAALTVATSTYVAYIKVNPYIPSEGYYLVGSMTEEYDGGWVPNPSYMFQPVANDDEEEDDSATSTTPSKYTLTVGSLSSTDKYYVAAVSKDGVITYYSSTSTGDTDMTPNDEVSLEAGYTNQMGTESNYLDVTFTLNMDVQAGVPNGLSFTGTEDNDIKNLVITPGNDKTNQSGTVDNEKMTITMQSERNNVWVYLYVPDESTNVMYAITDQALISSTQTLAEATTPSDYKNASPYADNVYTVALPTGYTGNLWVKYTASDNDTPTATYSFVVNKATPLGVEAVEAAEGEAEYFNLQGVKIANPEHGIFIKVQSGKASKVIL